MKRILFCLWGLMAAFVLSAQVNVSVTQKPVAGDDGQIDIVFSGKIEPGWHVYAPDNTDGPIPLTFHTDKLTGAKLAGRLKTGPAIRKMDEIFGQEVTYYENTFTATQRLQLTGGKWEVAGYLEYGACNDENCLPPTPVEFNYNGNYEAAPAPEAKETNARNDNDLLRPDTETDGDEPGDSLTAIAETESPDQAAITDAQGDADLWAPVTEQLQTLNTNAEGGSRSLWGIFLLGVIGGLLALIMPCIWPIIPMTVSFFLKRAKDEGQDSQADINKETKAGKGGRHKGVKDALLYGLSIIVIFVGLGLLVTLIWGPSKLNELSTNAIFNIFLFLLLLAFAASFLGGFEMTLPASWSNKIDSKATSTTGVLSIFLMAFTLVLVSFSCTAPIVGLLLVEMATSGNLLAPTLGMLGFSLALAAPFTLFALFPSWLKQAPKSGNWMNVVKVVLGLLELAFAFKFLSVADLAYGWRILDRETFLCVWILIFTLMGCYLLGWIRLPHDEDEYDENGEVIVRPKIGVTRFLGALCALSFALYMVPGLWGAPCKAVSAFAPPMWTQDFNLDPNNVEAVYTNYEEGIQAARKARKPVLLDFTGYGCVNCRKMEAAVWNDSRVRQLITQEYVLISLYVDDKTPLPETVEVTETDGTTRKLRTVGDKWSYLQRTKFGAQTQPFYVLLDHRAQPLAPAYSYNEDVPAYVQWLQSGLNNFSQRKE